MWIIGVYYFIISYYMGISNDFYYLSEIEEIIFILEKGNLFRIIRIKEGVTF